MDDDMRVPRTFCGSNMNRIYRLMINSIMSDGVVTSPRGKTTCELLHVSTTLTRPRERVLTVPGRNVNPFFLLADSLWLMSGESDSKWLLPFNTRLAQVLDADSTYFHGAYGERLRYWGLNNRLSADQVGFGKAINQLVDCYYKIKQDPETRQAVALIYNPAFDNVKVPTLDRPCNLALTFKLRNGRLHASTFNRSNDAVLGLTTTNIVQFTTIQEVLASWLGVQPGLYTHYSDSLHCYAEGQFGNKLFTLPPSGAMDFDVYDCVDPTAMREQTPAQFYDMIETLYEAVRGMLLATTEDQLKAVSSVNPVHQCPYWNSVFWALGAYRWYKMGLPYRALGMIEAMEVQDWKIECLRWMLRAMSLSGAKAREIATATLSSLATRLNEDQATLLLDYVLEEGLNERNAKTAA